MPKEFIYKLPKYNGWTVCSSSDNKNSPVNAISLTPCVNDKQQRIIFSSVHLNIKLNQKTLILNRKYRIQIGCKEILSPSVSKAVLLSNVNRLAEINNELNVTLSLNASNFKKTPAKLKLVVNVYDFQSEELLFQLQSEEYRLGRERVLNYIQSKELSQYNFFQLSDNEQKTLAKTIPSVFVNASFIKLEREPKQSFYPLSQKQRGLSQWDSLSASKAYHLKIRLEAGSLKQVDLLYKRAHLSHFILRSNNFKNYSGEDYIQSKMISSKIIENNSIETIFKVNFSTQITYEAPSELFNLYLKLYGATVPCQITQNPVSIFCPSPAPVPEEIFKCGGGDDLFALLGPK